MSVSPIERLRNLTAAEILTLAGCERHGRRWSPCPKCGHEGESRRGCVIEAHKGTGWHCPRCDTTAGALETLRLVSGLTDWRELFAYAEAHGWMSAGDGVRRYKRTTKTYQGLLTPLKSGHVVVELTAEVVSHGDGSRILTDLCEAFTEDEAQEIRAGIQQGRDAERRRFWAGNAFALRRPSPRPFVRGWRAVHTTDEVLSITTTKDGWRVSN